MGKPEKAVLVGIKALGEKEATTKEHLNELAFLAKAAGATPVTVYTQKLKHPNPKYFIGAGKLEDIANYVTEYKIDTVIFDDELSPAQIKNIEKLMPDNKILDRTNLILDIFANRAKTSQAKTQVELAQYEYLLPRLTRMWTHHSRQKGGIGTKGPGEKEIETDRRMIHKKIKQLEEQLKKIDKQNITQRKSRGEKVRVALVGYTNTGKSTLMNLMSKSEVKEENKLFATLDTTVRNVVVDDIPFLLSDTVGFIRKLPHKLVESFKSTLDEAIEADILVHVVDVSQSGFEDNIEVVNQTLKDLEAHDKPTITVFNKADHFYNPESTNGITVESTIEELENSWMAKICDRSYFISAKENLNVDNFKDALMDLVVETYKKEYPYKPIKVTDGAT